VVCPIELRSVCPGAGVAALQFLVIKLANESSQMAFGLYVGIIAAGALAVGGLLMFGEESAASRGAGNSRERP
jgi:hypothetical protein